jgi:biotin carboxyl carrier protein
VRYYVTVLSRSSPARREGTAPAPTLVDIVERADGTLEATVDGRAVELDVAPAGSQLSVRMDGCVIDVTARGNLPDLDIVASGMRASVRVESERGRSVRRTRTPPAGPDGTFVVKSPMPGRVVRVLVAKGDRIKAGQGVVVLEAMKMENEVRSATAGTVLDIPVSAGTAVEANAHLVTLATLAVSDP